MVHCSHYPPRCSRPAVASSLGTPWMAHRAQSPLPTAIHYCISFRRISCTLPAARQCAVVARCGLKRASRQSKVSRCQHPPPQMAAKAPTKAASEPAPAAAAAPEAGDAKSSSMLPDMPSLPDVSVPSPSQALTKAGDAFTATISAISSKAGEAIEVFGAHPPPPPPIPF